MTVGRRDDAVRRALNCFDKWNDVTGAITKHTSTYYEIQAVIGDAVDCGAQAALDIHEELESEKV